MKFQTLASGSKGNCSILMCGETNIIIDVGISYITLKNTLLEEKIDLNTFEYLLITHNHSDHIKGLKSLIKHTNITVYLPEKMYESLENDIPRSRCIFVDDQFNINDTYIELIHTSHDAPASVGYIFNYDGKSLVYVTDTGYINRKYLTKLEKRDVYVIESNHDEKMLMDGPYPRFLKERVISDKGHLSNSTTAKYLSKVVGKNTKHIILAHISETNNTEELAINTTRKELENYKINILAANQYEKSPFIEV